MMRYRRGYVFLQALIAVTALVALMVMLAANQRASLQSVQNRLRLRRADAAAQAGLARALAVISTANSNAVTLNDDWALLGSQSAQSPPADEEFQLDPDSTFRVQLVDAGALININYATSAQLLTLPLDQTQVDCLLDWRTTSTTPLADGAKDTFYNSLQTPYNTKLGPFTTVDELMLVDNWTTQTLYQTPIVSSTVTPPTDLAGNILPLASMLTVSSGAPTTQASGAARVNFSGRGLTAASLARLGIPPYIGNRIVARQPYTSFAALLSIPGLNSATMAALLNIAEFSTATRVEGKIDLNTASQQVLETIPNLNPDDAEAIVQQQSQGFPTLGTLATINLPAADVSQIADNFTIGSDTWIVRVYGSSGGVGDSFEGVIGLRNGLAQTISWSRINSAGIPIWWGWNAQPDTTEDAESTQ